MARLSELRGKQDQGSGGSDGVGTIRTAVPYRTPIECSYRGQNVTVLVTGDIVGMSPACQIVDENGRFDWVSQDDLTVTQRDILPQREADRKRLHEQSHQSVGSQK